MANAQSMLSTLRKVRKTALGEWVACCPAHDDRSPSLTVKETADGRVLVHCFSGCSAAEVVGAIGMTLADLMPERLTDSSLPRMPWNPRTVLEAVANNATILALMATDTAHGKSLTYTDKDKMVELAGEILEAVEYATR